MSTLTGQQINQSYQGLLKLADSSTGITESFQAIQDGLGNNTGLRIATGQLEVPNIPGIIKLQPKYMSTAGCAASNATQQASGTQNVIIAYPFYDSGEYSYSAISYNLINATSTSDTVEAAIYTSQMISPYGLYPYEPIVSGITLTTTGSTGFKTDTITSFSMSGYGGGVYWFVYKVSNAGVQPTVRFGTASLTTTLTSLWGTQYGASEQFTANAFTSFERNNGGIGYVFTGTTTFNNPFSNTINTTQSTTSTITGNRWGFVLTTENH